MISAPGEPPGLLAENAPEAAQPLESEAFGKLDGFRGDDLDRPGLGALQGPDRLRLARGEAERRQLAAGWHAGGRAVQDDEELAVTEGEPGAARISAHGRGAAPPAGRLFR